MKSPLRLSKRTVLIFIFSIFCSWEFYAQGDCQAVLDMASEQYKLGQFSKIRETLKMSCLEKANKSASNTNRANELLALVAIAEDNNADAIRLIKEILKNDPEFVFQKGDANFIFKKIKNKQKALLVDKNTMVRSVSKRPENLKTAPATVELIEAKDILARGYTDLIDLLSDIPGFEISKTYSVLYANFHQLGFRQTNSERTLVMVDGVEENDLWLNWAYLSRQYPISNIKQVEIIYGPASTMYGSGAFLGAINIITYQKGEKPGNYFGDRANLDSGDIYFYGGVEGGAFNTKGVDFTIGSSIKKNDLNQNQSDKNDFSFQLTGRYYTSDEHDMSTESFFNYDASDLDRFEYDHLATSLDDPSSLPGYFNTFSNNDLNNDINLNNFISSIDPNGYLSVSEDGTSLGLSSAGLDFVRFKDNEAYSGLVNGSPMDFSNHTKDFFIGAKLDFKNLTFGFRGWKRTEGFNTLHQDVDVAPSKNGTVWAPENQTLYLKYNDSFNDFSLSFLTTFKNHKLGRETNQVNFRPFGDNRTSLTLSDVVNYSEDEDGTEHGWMNRFYFYQALEGRADIRLYYDKKNYNVSFGTDYRIKSSQGDYLIYENFEWRQSDPQAFSDYIYRAFAQNFGLVDNQEAGSNMFLVKNYSWYVQGSLNIKEKLFFSAGIRHDIGKTRTREVIDEFSPRLGITYNNKNWAIKVNYSKGFQTASLYTRFSTEGDERRRNVNIRPEEMDYVDFSFIGNSNDNSFKWNLTGFKYNMTNTITLEQVQDRDFTQYMNSGDFDVFGAMANFKYVTKNLRVDLNGTFFNPNKIEAGNQTRVGDIASFRSNLGVTSFLSVDGFKASINLRANYVGKKPVGIETTQFSNTGFNDMNEIPAYYILNGNLILGHKNFPYAKLSISINNILDNLYYHPGVRTASGDFDLRDKPELSTEYNYSNWMNESLWSQNPPYVPQRRRHLFFKLLLDL